MDGRKILIIEDDSDINNMVSEALSKAGYACVQAFSGTEGLMCFSGGGFALILLDLMLPGMAGENVIAKVKEGSNVPVIVMSAKDSIDTKVDLLASGAEDYITKPFDIKELIARVEVQLRRFSPPTASEEAITYKELILCPSTYSATACGVPLDLTKHEYSILELLLKHPDKVFSKQAIYDYAWDEYYMGEDKTVGVHVSNIRRKIRSVTQNEYIETVWGIGFKLKQ